MDSDLTVTWDDHGREPKCPPDPAYPHGRDVFMPPGGVPACSATLPYPAPRCGLWFVRCGKCGISVGITAAGRPDDPRSIRVPCQLGATGEFLRGKLDETDEGALNIALAADAANNLVRIDFGKQVAWLALSPPEALELANAIAVKAMIVDKQKKRQT